MPPLELQIDPSSPIDILVSPLAYPPNTLRGDLIAIRPAQTPGTKGKPKDRPLLYKVDRMHEDQQAKQEQLQGNTSRRNKPAVVVSANVAQSFPWIKNRQQVSITLVHSPPPPSMVASHVELYFKDLYLSRADMLRLSLSLANTVVHLSQRVTLPGSLARLRVGGLFDSDHQTVRSAWVDDDTKIVFRSESARVYVFVEMSQEMWHFEEDGSMLREKCEVFLHELFMHWTGRAEEGMDKKSKGNPTSHTVSIILYGRVIYEDNGEGEEARAPLRTLEDGTLYRDFYKVILSYTPSPSPSIVREVVAEIRSWQESVLLRLLPSGSQKLAGRIAYAHESPVLEAANLALNSFEEHWIDRDLQRTGLEILVLTAGTSFYQVPKQLLRLTTERMLFHGIGLDLISLSKTPLHTVPLFSFPSHEPGLSEQGPTRISPTSGGGGGGGPLGALNVFSATSGATSSHLSSTNTNINTPPRFTPSSTTTRDTLTKEALRLSLPDDQRDPLYYDSTHPSQETSTYYSEPMFIFCSFFGSQIDKPHRVDRFMPRARCYELFSQGVGERMEIAIPLLPSLGELEKEEGEEGGGGVMYLSEVEKRAERRERYDRAAVGAKGFGGGEDLGAWERQSGVTSGTSTSEGSGLGSLAVSRSTREKEKGRSRREVVQEEEEEEEEMKTTTTTGSGLGLMMGPRRVGVDRRSASEAIPSSSSTHFDAERGRGAQVAEVRGLASDSRSRTPVPRDHKRSSSVAASIRTVSSIPTSHKDSSSSSRNKSATPALIARLTSVASPAPSSSSSSSSTTTATTTTRQGGWLGLFGRSTTGSSATPAPSVAVQKVDAKANVKPEFDLEGTTTAALSHALSDSASSSTTKPSHSRATSPSSSSRHSTASRPTQPISISTRAEQTREADRPSTKTGGGNQSPSLKIVPPVMGGRRSGVKSTASRFNPSKPGKQSVGLADQARRWASIFIRHSNDQRRVNWVSVARGACLPLTTDYLPSADALATQYSDYRYSIPTSNLTSSPLLRTDNPRRTPVLELITELISQRLSHGFQCVTPANHAGVLDEINLASSKTLPDVLRDIHDGEITAVYLTLTNQIHRIWYDRRTQTVLVKIMRRRRSWIKENYDYGCLIFTQGSKAYRQSSIEMPYPNMIEPVDWQHLDRLIAGVEKLDLRPSLRFWRTRLVLLPCATIPDREYIVSKTKALALEGEPTDAMIQDQGFHTFMELVENARWSAPGEEREQTPITHTTLSAPDWAASVARNPSSSSSTDDAAPAPPPRQTTISWLTRIKVGDSTSSQPSTPAIESTPSFPSSSSPSTDSAPPKKPTVQMSYAVMLDLDPSKRSPRSERVLFHFDRSHNTQAAYHCELNWLAGSGKVIDMAIQNWARQVARFGLNLIEVGTRAVGDAHNPFQRAMEVKLVVPPPSLEGTDLPEHYYESALLQSLDFFLDLGADSTFPSDVDVQYSYRRAPTSQSQFIHRSGTLLVAILGGEDGFAYMPNRIFTSHAQGLKPDEAMSELVRICSDEKRLEELWKQLQSEVEVKVPTEEEQ